MYQQVKVNRLGLTIMVAGILVMALILPTLAFAGEPVEGAEIFLTQDPSGDPIVNTESGGSYTLDSFGSLDVPADALVPGVDVSVVVYDYRTPWTAQDGGKVYRIAKLEPDGAVFTRDLTLSLRIPPGVRNPRAYEWDAAQDTWVQMVNDDWYYEAGNIGFNRIRHFSWYGIGGSAASPCVSPPANLVAWWPLDEVGGTTNPNDVAIRDLVGQNCGKSKAWNGTQFVDTPVEWQTPPTSGPTSVQGEVMGALLLSADVNYVEVPNSSTLNFGGGSFTIDAWIKPNMDSGLGCNIGTDLHVSPIVDKWDAATGNGQGYRLFVVQNLSLGTLNLHFEIGDSSPPLSAAVSTLPGVYSPWVHVAAVYTPGPSDTIELYVDGAPTPFTFTHIGSLDNTRDLLIGRMNPLPPPFVDQGYCEMPVDEIEIFNRALSQPEINAIAAAGPGGKCKQRVSLPATRQITCYNPTTGAVQSCALTSTSEDGRIQAGVAWPNPRFQYNNDSTYTDMLTGLVWPQAGTPPASPCGTGGAMCWWDALNYVACLNSLNVNGVIGYLGYNDWRLPNINELAFVHAALDPLPSFLPQWLLSQGFTNVQNDNYWSSTTSAGSPSQAWAMDFSTGIADYDPKCSPGYLRYIWPVRQGPNGNPDPNYPANIWKTGQTTCYDPAGTIIPCAGTGQDGELQRGIDWPSQRFARACSTCEVTDNLTGLTWTNLANTMLTSGTCPDGQQSSWYDALDYVKCLNTISLCGKNDWRLPNVNELRSLVDYSQFDPARQSSILFGVHSNHYWASTANAGTNNPMSNQNDAWNVDFWGGGVYHDLHAPMYVWPVRGGSGGSLCVPVYAGTNHQTITPVTGVNVTFASSNVCQSGNLCATAITSTTNPPANFQLMGNTYDLTFSALCPGGDAQVCIDVAHQCISGAGIHHHNGSNWSQLSNGTSSQISQAPLVCRYCGDTTSFSEFGVMEPIDTTPDLFNFTDQTGVTLNTLTTSNSITVSGINATSPISVTGGEYSINGGAFTAAAGTVNNGNTAQVRLTSSGSYATTVSATLTIGGVSDTFSVTTMTYPEGACTTCHGAKTLTMAMADNSCQDCHTAHDTASANASCLVCHTAPATNGGGIVLTPAQAAAYAYNIHNSTPIARFSWSNDSTTSYKINFNAAGTTCPNGYTCTYSWNFGDACSSNGGTTGVTTYCVYADTDPASKSVTLTVSVTNGQSDTETHSVTPASVNAAPACGAGSVAYGADRRNVTFTQSGADSLDGSDVLYINWGDGSPLTVATPNSSASHAYATAKQYPLKYMVKDSGGLSCKDSLTVDARPVKYTVTVNTSPALGGASVYIKTLTGLTRSFGSTNTGGSFVSSSLTPAQYKVYIYKTGKTFDCDSGTAGNQMPVTVDISSTSQTVTCTYTP